MVLESESREAGDEISSRTCVVVFKCCEMSLMRDFAVVAFQIYPFKCFYYILYVLSVNDNIGLNLFT